MSSILQESTHESFLRLVNNNPVLVCLDYAHFGKDIRDLKRQQEKRKTANLLTRVFLVLDKFIPFVPEVVLGVPPAPNSKIRRGYNLTVSFSEAIGRHYSVENLDILHSRRNSEQKELGKHQRESRPSNIYVDKLWTDCLKEVNSVWVVDDVVTTGSTMNQVFNCLSEINPKLKLFGVGICGKRF